MAWTGLRRWSGCLPGANTTVSCLEVWNLNSWNKTCIAFKSFAMLWGMMRRLTKNKKHTESIRGFLLSILWGFQPLTRWNPECFLVWPQSWPCEQEVGVGAFQGSILTWIILICASEMQACCSLLSDCQLRVRSLLCSSLPSPKNSFPLTIDLHVTGDQSVGDTGIRSSWVQFPPPPGQLECSTASKSH